MFIYNSAYYPIVYNVYGENLKLQITKFSLNANRKDASIFTDRCPRYSSDSHPSLFDHKVTIAESDQHFEQEPKVNEEHPILLHFCHFFLAPIVQPVIGQSFSGGSKWIVLFPSNGLVTRLVHPRIVEEYSKNSQ